MIKKFTFILAVLGIIIPIAWDWYKNAVDVELLKISSTTIVQVLERPKQKLEIFYGGQKVPSLSKMVFQYKNTGRQSIQSKDINSKPVLTFEGDCRILEVNIESTQPNNLEVDLLKELNGKTITIDSPLMNSDDQVIFDVLLSGEVSNVKSAARIAGVKELVIKDLVAQKEIEKNRIPLKFYIVLIFTILSIFLSFVAVISSFKIRKLKKSYDEDKLIPSDGISFDQLSSLIKSLADSGFTKNELRRMYLLQAKAEGSEELPQDFYGQVVEEINELLVHTPGAIIAGWFMFLISILGIYYLWPYFINLTSK